MPESSLRPEVQKRPDAEGGREDLEGGVSFSMQGLTHEYQECWEALRF